MSVAPTFGRPYLLARSGSLPRAAGPEAVRISVVIPAYLSHDTVADCLESLRRQEAGGFEVVVVDSSPDDRTADAVRRFPEVRLVRSPRRLLPHAARNLGAVQARGELLVFTDPDVYARPAWLRELVSAYEATGQPVVGSLSCHGQGWLDTGIHLCKFSKWLPAGSDRSVDMGPTANLLVDRATFAAVGGFEGEYMLADVVLTWRLQEAGKAVWFAPRAEVAHHHVSTFRGFLRERYSRGVLFGELRSGWQDFDLRRGVLFLGASLLLLRLPRILWLVAGHARQAGLFYRFVATLPVVAAGHAASLLGEARAYLARLAGREAGAPRRAAGSATAEATAPLSPGVRR